MKPVGILGGTFDPVHIGHLITAQSLLEKRNLQKIIFVPCYISPHKTQGNYSLPHHRMNMLKLAIEGIDKFDYSSFEIDKADISYTYDSLMEFRKIYDNIELIIGYDNLFKFDTWKEPDKVIELATLVVMNRRTGESELKQDKFSRAAVYVDTPHIEVSSTVIRERIRNKLPVDFLVTEKVKEYIYTNKLYI